VGAARRSRRWRAERRNNPAGLHELLELHELRLRRSGCSLTAALSLASKSVILRARPP